MLGNKKPFEVLDKLKDRFIVDLYEEKFDIHPGLHGSLSAAAGRDDRTSHNGEYGEPNNVGVTGFEKEGWLLELGFFPGIRGILQ